MTEEATKISVIILDPDFEIELSTSQYMSVSAVLTCSVIFLLQHVLSVIMLINQLTSECENHVQGHFDFLLFPFFLKVIKLTLRITIRKYRNTVNTNIIHTAL
jgi:hypothetical protein